MTKRKTFVLMVSKTFPQTHKRSGESTGFVENIKALFSPKNSKIHTIRSNYELWRKRSEQINEGKAVLSIRYWSDKPYKSKQVEIARLEKIGVERLDDPTNFVFAPIEGEAFAWIDIAKNDGLSFDDFCEWFKVRQPGPMAIVHFTEFRYKKP
jgi:hypothetical protein